VGRTAAIDTDRLFFQNVEDDGNIMRRQIPRHVDVSLKQSKVQAAGAHIPDIPDVTAIHDLLDFAHGR
jgi:hypothetical protein